MSRKKPWQPPHPDNKQTPGRVYRRKGPGLYIDDLRNQIPRSERCAWEECVNLRTEMLDTDGRRFPVCDEHILRTARAYERGLRATRNKIAKGQEPGPGDQMTGLIYYARIGDAIKIGYSTDVYKRMRQYPPTSELLAVEPGTKQLERARHSLFHVHLAHGREWFHPNGELDAWIAQVIEKHGPPPFEDAGFKTPDTRPIVASKRTSYGRAL